MVAEHMDIGTDRIVTVRDIRENNGYPITSELDVFYSLALFSMYIISL